MYCRPALSVLSAAVLVFGWPQRCFAVDTGLVAKKVPESDAAVAAASQEPILQPFAPITGGETYDSDDTYFMDVNLSLKIRLSPAALLPQIRPFLAMSTRFGFYWGSRPGSPVIGKSYNPELFFRIIGPHETIIKGPDGAHYEYRQFFNVGYGHESNGQLIHTPQQYQQQLLNTPGPAYADNFIHRGWDYADFAWKRTWEAGVTEVTSYLEAKYFLPDGLLQGPEDEYHSWEANPQGKPRKAVDGIEETVEWPSQNAHFVVECSQGIWCRPNLTVKYLTGYEDPFRYDTIRGEFGFQLATLPLAIWVQHGYMSSLANYYKDVNSVGVEVRFESF
jgi:outer membrane phospholipase A